MEELGRIIYPRWVLIFVAAICLLMPHRTTAAVAIEKVAESNHQWTGIAVAADGRMFVNFPTWNDYPADYRVAELRDGQEIPYPNAEWNHEFVCVQSVVADDANHLWILDPAKLRGQDVSPSGARLYDVDLATNQVKRIYIFPQTTALPQSYLNDVRIDTKRRTAYLTDSGVGGIIVLDLDTGDSWRAITDVPEVKANLSYIDFKSTGRNTHLSQSDGIELSENGEVLYFTALGGDILYQVPTKALCDKKLSISDRQETIEILSRSNVPTDGMILHKEKLYMANLPEETIWEFDLKTRQGHNLALPIDIRWADSFAKGTDGSIYFTTSQINYPMENRKKYELYRMTVDKS